MQTSQIKTYYDELAQRYDHDRFANTYGAFIDRQERRILRRYLKQPLAAPTIDLACGTGRFMDFCTAGLDISPEMLRIAREKHPDKAFHEGNILQTPLPTAKYQAALSFHLIMHLDAPDLARLLLQTHQLLQPGGLFIFDLPSQERRALLRTRTQGWHGSNAYRQTEVKALLQNHWKIIEQTGILFLPIHRLPTWARRPLTALDTLLCRTALKKYASYRVYVLQKISPE